MMVPLDPKAFEEPETTPLGPIPMGSAVMTAAAIATTMLKYHLTKQLKPCSKPGCRAHGSSWGCLQRVLHDRIFPQTTTQVRAPIMQKEGKS